jgi:hypothetical protein
VRVRQAGVVLAAAAAMLTGCVVASPDDDTYRDAVASTIGSAAGEVATVRTMVSLLRRDRIPRPAVVAQLRYSEESLGRSTQSFLSLNQPAGEDHLAEEAARLLDESATAMRAARRAVHRHEVSDYPRVIADLHAVGDDLETLEKSSS